MKVNKKKFNINKINNFKKIDTSFETFKQERLIDYIKTTKKDICSSSLLYLYLTWFNIIDYLIPLMKLDYIESIILNDIDTLALDMLKIEPTIITYLIDSRNKIMMSNTIINTIEDKNYYLKFEFKLGNCLSFYVSNGPNMSNNIMLFEEFNYLNLDINTLINIVNNILKLSNNYFVNTIFNTILLTNTNDNNKINKNIIKLIS
ncbi:hypothetical protein [Deferribacter desulfuricans]|nr:hypothetical protein [Deferribacter desulfuricans]